MWCCNVRGAVAAAALVGSATLAVTFGSAGWSPRVLVVALAVVGALTIGWILGTMQKLKSRCSQLEADRSAAVAAVIDRDDRLAVVSHDLRTPLQAILLCTHMLAKQSASDKSRPQLRVLASAVNRMEQVIGSLLATGRLDAGVFSVHCEPCAVSMILDYPIEQFGPRFAERTVPLALEYTELVVMADPERIKEVIRNLLENALTYSHPGGRVVVMARAVEHEVRFSVRAHGGGVAPADIPHLFERNGRGHSTEPDGLGVGLYICKRLVESHRGAIGARSIDTGIELWFTLPRADHVMRTGPVAALALRPRHA